MAPSHVHADYILMLIREPGGALFAPLRRKRYAACGELLNREERDLTRPRSLRGSSGT